LEKWSCTTLRRAGLCEDHFTPDSFNPKSVKKGLKRDAVPIPYNSRVDQKNSNKQSERKRKNLNETDSYIKENITGLSHLVELNAESFTPISDNVTIDKQLLQEPPLKTYKPAHLYFDVLAEEDMMDWIHIEPTHERVSTTVLQNNVNKKIEENKENNITDKVNNSEIIINS